MLLEKWNAALNTKAIATMFYTSGTSGKSKGVMLSQENIMSDINSVCKHFFSPGNTHTVLLFNHSFELLNSVFVETLHRTIWQTAKEQGSERKLRSAMELSNFLLRCGIDVRKKLFRTILDSFGGNLTYIVCSGVPLQEKYVREFRAFGIEVLNGYGITECAPVVSTNCNFYHRDGSVGQILKCCDIRIQTDAVRCADRDARTQTATAAPLVGEIQVKGIT